MFPQIFGKYVLERPLAVGGMARVYLATLRGAGGFEKKLVVKQIRAELATDDAFVRRFVTEAKTTVELSHPNIVPVYELGVEQGVYYLAMELCDGVTLAELLQKTGKLTPDEGAYVGIEICRALDYAHRKARIVHRDVTPRNVIIDEEGGVRLIDFGIAAHSDGGTKREVFGSPGHMAPEQFRGEEVGPSADVFSVATLLYEAWSSKPPFRRRTPEQSQAALFEPVATLSTFEPSLESLDVLMASALSVNAADRPQSAEDLSRPLRRFIADRDLGDVTRKVGERVRELRTGSDPKVRPAIDDTPSSLAPAANVTRTFATRSYESSGRTPVRRTSKPPPADLTPHQATRRMNDDAASWSTAGRPPAPSVSPRPARGRALLAGLLGFAIAGVAAATWRYVEPRSSRAAASGDEIAGPILQSDPRTSDPRTTATASNVTADSASSLGAPQATPAASVEVSGATTNLIDVAPKKGKPGPGEDMRRAGEPESTLPARNEARPQREAENPPNGAAHLRILANPAANVEVDGRSRGAAPILDLAVSPGNHLIRLDCATLGEAVSQNVPVAAGEVVTVSGDFTGAHGRILVRRTGASQ